MKYRLLLKLLRALVYLKRATWWVGRRLGSGANRVGRSLWWVVGYSGYRITYCFQKNFRLTTLKERLLTRPVLQGGFFLALMAVSIPQTKLITRHDLSLATQKTLAFHLVSSSDQEISVVEEVVAEAEPGAVPESSQREELVAREIPVAASVTRPPQLGSLESAGMLRQPVMISGPGAAASRLTVIEYIIEPGDSLSSIAVDFDVSVATILWENQLGLRSVLKPGQVLRIPPVSGVLHTVRRGDTLTKVVTLYEAKAGAIIAFNRLDPQNPRLIIGERIMIPDGIKREQRALTTVPRTAASVRRVARPAPAPYAPSASGFVWPAGVRYLTQYFSWRHNGLDIAGPWHTPIYATKAGVVEIAQCGWNGGYGCYIIINHGGGFKSTYGHNSELLVQVGEEVTTGQTIALMGNSGNVRGRTGIHVHFEIIVNGARVNPLRYVR